MPEAYLVRQDNGDRFTPDVVMSIGYSRDAKITSHPIEDGSTVSDHSQPGNMPITLKAMVTETPFAFAGQVGGISRVRQAAEWIDTAMKSGALLTLVSRRMGSKANCLLKGFNYTVDSRRRLIFDVRIVQVTIATATEIMISEEDIAESEDSSYSYTDEVDVGEQATTTTETDETAEEEDISALAALLDSIG